MICISSFMGPVWLSVFLFLLFSLFLKVISDLFFLAHDLRVNWGSPDPSTYLAQIMGMGKALRMAYFSSGSVRVRNTTKPLFGFMSGSHRFFYCI